VRKTVRDAVLTISIVLLIWVIAIIVVNITQPPDVHNCSIALREIDGGLDYHLHKIGFFPETDDSFIWVHWYKQYLIETRCSWEDAEHWVRHFIYCPSDTERHKKRYPASYAFNLVSR